MDKKQFVDDLKKSLLNHYNKIECGDELISFGIYTDGDASTIGIYYNTLQNLQKCMESSGGDEIEKKNESLHFTFFMEEWSKDISLSLKETRLDELTDRINKFRAEEYEKGSENYKDEILNLFATSLKALNVEGVFKSEKSDFFLHLEVSDSWISDTMLNRISTIQKEDRFLEFKEYAKSNNG